MNTFGGQTDNPLPMLSQLLDTKAQEGGLEKAYQNFATIFSDINFRIAQVASNLQQFSTFAHPSFDVRRRNASMSAHI